MLSGNLTYDYVYKFIFIDLNIMKIVSVMPIKLNNERLPGKNTKILVDKPLINYGLDTLLYVPQIDERFVFCSSKEICKYIPEQIHFLQRDTTLDLPTSNFNQIFDAFMNEVDADIYVYIHATAPYIKATSIQDCIEKVASGKYDSAFTAIKIQDYLWENGVALNFDPTNLPRSQDLTPIFRETSGVYVFTKEQYLKNHRRIGDSPYIKEVSIKEAVDINNAEDFKIAEIFYNVNL